MWKSSLLGLLSICLLFLLIYPKLSDSQADPADWAASKDRMEQLNVGGESFIQRRILANTFTSSTQDSVTLALQGDDRVLLAWQSRRQEEGTYGVYGQLFSALGIRSGPEMHLNQTTRSHQTEPVLAVDGQGNSFAGWCSFGQDGDRGGIYIRRLDRKEEIPVHEMTKGDQKGLRLMGRPNGGVIAAWTHEDREQHLRIRSFDRNGSPLTGEIEVASGKEAPITLSLAGMGGTGSLLVWATKGQGILAKRLDQDGNLSGSTLFMDRPSCSGIEPVVARGPKGGFLVSWLDKVSQKGRYRIMARRIGPTGGSMGRLFQVAPTGPDYLSGVNVAVGPKGRAFFAWNRESLHGRDGSRLEGRFLSSQGELGCIFPLGDKDRRRAGLLKSNGRPCLAFGSKGQVLVAWTGSAGLGDRKGAHLTMMIPIKKGLEGDVDRNNRVDKEDLVALERLLTGRSDRLDHFGAADLDGNGRVDGADLSRLQGVEGIQESLNRLRRWSQTVAKAGKTAKVREVASTGKEGLVHVNEVAAPHEVPIIQPASSNIGVGDFNPLAIYPDLGFQAVNSGWNPPDPHMAAGPNHIIVTGNVYLAFYDKKGIKSFQQSISGSTGFWGSLGATSFVFDPEVFYDPLAKRFIAFANERNPSNGSGNSYFLLAVSDDQNPNGTWYKYRFNVTNLANIGYGGGDIDSPNFGSDSQAYYMTADFFNGGQHFLVYIVDKASILAGKTPAITRSHLVKGSQSFGIPVQWGAAPAMYMIEHFENSSNTKVRLHAISNSLTSPTRVTYNLTVPAYGRPGRPVQMGSTSRPATFDARFWSCVWRNGSLWACHHHGTTLKSRWYEIKTNNWPISGTPTLVQSGDLSPSPGTHAFFNSISVDGQGNALMVFAQSSTSSYLSIGRAWRKASDPLGTMRPVQVVKASSGPYNGTRWGDYSAVAPDPVEPNSLWYYHEYATSTNRWSTWVGMKKTATLAVDQKSLSNLAGGTLRFTLDNPSHANKLYVLLGTMSGTSPGINLGSLHIPLNQDTFTNLGLGLVGAPMFQSFLGYLDPKGLESATFVLPPATGLQGTSMDFVFLQYNGAQWDFASNTVNVKIGI